MMGVFMEAEASGVGVLAAVVEVLAVLAGAALVAEVQNEIGKTKAH